MPYGIDYPWQNFHFQPRTPLKDYVSGVPILNTEGTPWNFSFEPRYPYTHAPESMFPPGPPEPAPSPANDLELLTGQTQPMAGDPQWLETALRALEEARLPDEPPPGLMSPEDLEILRRQTRVGSGLHQLGAIAASLSGNQGLAATLGRLSESGQGRLGQAEALARQEMIRRQTSAQNLAMTEADWRIKAGLAGEKIAGQQDVAQIRAAAQMEVAKIRQRRAQVTNALSEMKARLAQENNPLIREKLMAQIGLMEEQAHNLAAKEQQAIDKLEFEKERERSLAQSREDRTVLGALLYADPHLAEQWSNARIRAALGDVGETIPGPGTPPGGGETTSNLEANARRLLGDEAVERMRVTASQMGIPFQVLLSQELQKLQQQRQGYSP